MVSGSGTLKTGGGAFEIGEGDCVSLPVGESGGRQVINSSDGPLHYLCLSTMIEPEIVTYPDSGKLGLFAGSAPDSTTWTHRVRTSARRSRYDGSTIERHQPDGLPSHRR